MINLFQNTTTLTLTAALLASTAIIGSSQAAPKYKADVPAYIQTPDVVKTELLGELNFFDGLPDDKTAQKAYDFLNVSRAAQAFLNGIPTASIYGFLEGLKQVGVQPGDFELVT
ncbi:MAG: hypothetical protein ACC707_01190 [Thiohalomonadales bacterium]